VTVTAVRRPKPQLSVSPTSAAGSALTSSGRTIVRLLSLDDRPVERRAPPGRLGLGEARRDAKRGIAQRQRGADRRDGLGAVLDEREIFRSAPGDLGGLLLDGGLVPGRDRSCGVGALHRGLALLHRRVHTLGHLVPAGERERLFHDRVPSMRMCEVGAKNTQRARGFKCFDRERSHALR
jgi:hypothetical protein